MASQNLLFFMRSEELWRIVVELTKKHDLWVMVPDGDFVRALDLTQLEAEGMSAITAPDYVYISAEKPESSHLLIDVAPARLGWVQLNLPKESGHALTLGDIGIKPEWYDDSTGETGTNDELKVLYRTLKTEFKRRITTPVWAQNIKTGGIASYAYIGVSPLAMEWEANGGELRQEGVENLRFSASKLASE